MNRILRYVASGLCVVLCATSCNDDTSGPEQPPLGDTLIDARDGNEYKIVQLGDQVWMAENLRYLPEQHFDVSSKSPRYYVMLDNIAGEELGDEFLKMYGAYYNLPAALQGETPLAVGESRVIRGVCPEGWHIPAQEEWDRLAAYVRDNGLAAVGSDGVVDETALAKALAAPQMWMLPPDTEEEPQPTWVGVDMEKNNATGFNGMPVGFRAVAGDEAWMHLCYSAGWWSATQSAGMGEGFVYAVRLWSDYPLFVTNSDFSVGVGLPVRCLKD